jgi:hypothetical protein
VLGTLDYRSVLDILNDGSILTLEVRVQLTDDASRSTQTVFVLGCDVAGTPDDLFI